MTNNYEQLSVAASSRNYNMSDAGFSQRGSANNTRWAKDGFMKRIDQVLPKFKFHLDEQRRLQELAECIHLTFTYDQLVDYIYKDEHEACINSAMSAQAENLTSQVDAYKSQLAEIREQLQASENTNDQLEIQVETLTLEKEEMKRKIDKHKSKVCKASLKNNHTLF